MEFNHLLQTVYSDPVVSQIVTHNEANFILLFHPPEARSREGDLKWTQISPDPGPIQPLMSPLHRTGYR